MASSRRNLVIQMVQSIRFNTARLEVFDAIDAGNSRLEGYLRAIAFDYRRSDLDRRFLMRQMTSIRREFIIILLLLHYTLPVSDGGNGNGVVSTNSFQGWLIEAFGGFGCGPRTTNRNRRM